MRSAFTEAVRLATEQRAGTLSDLEGSEAGVSSVAQLFKAEIARVANATGSDVSWLVTQSLSYAAQEEAASVMLRAPDWTCSHWVHGGHRKIFRQACFQIEYLWKLELERPDAGSHMESEWAGGVG